MNMPQTQRILHGWAENPEWIPIRPELEAPHWQGLHEHEVQPLPG